MNDVKNTFKPLEWTSTVSNIDKTSFLPMVVKPTPATAEKYQISEDPLLLHHYWVTQRLIAQSLEDEGAYVVGPQLEISSDYSGTFRYRHDLKGNSEVVQVFNTVKEIAMSMPEKVFPQERIVVYPVSTEKPEMKEEKVNTVVLQSREHMTVLRKQDISTLVPMNRVPFGKPRYKQVTVPSVVFYNESTKETVILPLTTKGRFSTLSYIPSQARELDFKDILKEIDIPINLTTCHNCPQTLLDQHFLRSGVRLRITAIEEHEVILGVTIQEKIVEFASGGVDFVLPKHLAGGEDREQEIAYQTALQRFLMECQIKNSPVNIKDYRKSIRNHVSRSVCLTSPRALSQVAITRRYKVPKISTQVQDGIPAIAFISSLSQLDTRRRSSLPNDRTSRPPAPLPHVDHQKDAPPLPPRNSRNVSSARWSPRPFNAGSFDLRTNEPPLRPPPPPPTEAPLLPERPKAHSTSSFMDARYTDESVWDTLDANSMQRLREERSSLRRKNIALPFHYTFNGIPELQLKIPVDEIPENETKIRAVSLDDIERSPSPTFDAFPLNPVSSSVPQTIPLILNLNENSPMVLAASESSNEPRVSPYGGDDNDSNSGLIILPQTTSATDLRIEDPDGPFHPDAEPIAIGDVAASIFQTTDADGPPFHSNYENIRLPIVENQPESKETDAIYYEYGEEEKDIVESSSPGNSKPNFNGESSASSSRSSTSSKSDLESEPGDQISPKDSPASSRSSSRQLRDNGFHVSQYSVVSDDSDPVSQQVSFTCNYLPSPKDWTPPADLSEMTVEEVAHSMRFIGMNEDTVEWFRAEKVDGQLFCSIQDDFIAEHFRLTPFHRKKLALFLKGWRPKLK